MKGIEALRGLPKELRKEVIANIIYSPFERSKELNKYLNKSLDEEVQLNTGNKRPCSAVFALGFNWGDSPAPYGYWRDKFYQLEGYRW